MDFENSKLTKNTDKLELAEEKGHMSKYDPLWRWISEKGIERSKLTYAEIEKIVGFPIDHSFLTYKKELLDYGYKVGKISIKEKTVIFERQC